MKTIIIDPLGEARRPQYKVAPRLADLNGKVLGLFDNSKPNFNIFLDRLEEQLRGRYALAGVVRSGKETAKRGAPAKAIEDLAREADVIINGMGDWGSCTSWSVHDGIEIEKLGKPTVTLCSTVFENMARSEAEALGLKDAPLVVVPHPIGGLPAARVRAKADAALDEIVANLVQPAAVPA